jgi:hypothetical protein
MDAKIKPLERSCLEFRRALRVPRFDLVVHEKFRLRANSLHDRSGVDEPAHKRFVGRQTKRHV